MKLKEKLTNILVFAKARKLYAGLVAVTVVLITFAVVITVMQASGSDRIVQTTLEQLERDREQKAKEQAEKDAAEASEGHTLDVQFTDLSAGDLQKSPCSQLQNRPGILLQQGTCNYNIKAHGKLTMAIVYVYDYDASAYATLNNGNANDKSGLRYINTYLRQQAARYKVKDPPSISLTSYGPFKVTKPILNIYYRDNGMELLSIFADTSAANKVPEGNFDMVHYVLVDYMYGGMAMPGVHRAFTYNGSSAAVPTFIHETLHLLGASDKYNNNDCSTIGTNDPFGRYSDSLPGSDIMCSNFSVDDSKINDITAREIGWAN